MADIVYVYIPDGLADWELGFITPELNTAQYFKRGREPYVVKTFGLNGEPVTTMGGLRILPDLIIGEVSTQEAALLLLPGSDTWPESRHAPVLEKAREFLDADIVVAAICGATVALANAGLLNDQPHTSNDLDYLKTTCPAYHGEARYRHEPAVTDGTLITASGVAPLEFAYHVLKRLDVFSEDTLSAWYKLYVTHEARYFFQLMQSLPQRISA
jgi:putative intracellular protease/amidase